MATLRALAMTAVFLDHGPIIAVLTSRHQGGAGNVERPSQASSNAPNAGGSPFAERDLHGLRIGFSSNPGRLQSRRSHGDGSRVQSYSSGVVAPYSAERQEPVKEWKAREEVTTGLSVSILGSFRKHYPQIVATVKEFEEGGVAVNSPVGTEIINPGELFARFAGDSPNSPEYVIQELTFAKIFASDFVYIVAPDGYIGRTTCLELGHVRERGIPVFFSEVVCDLPIEISADSVCGPSDAVGRMMTAGRSFSES